MDAYSSINSAYELYKKNWRTFASAFGLMLAVGLVAAVVGMAAGFMEDLSEVACNQGTPGVPTQMLSNALCEYTQPLSLIRQFLDLAAGIVCLFVVFAVLKSLEELAAGKPVSDWKAHIGAQAPKAIKFFFLELAITIISVLPLLIALIYIFQTLSSGLSGGQSMEEQLAVIREKIINLTTIITYLLVLLLALLVSVLIKIVLTLLSSFARVEMALEGKGMVAAFRDSSSLVRKNLPDVLAFHVLWLIISVAAAVVAFVTCCLMVFVSPLLTYFLIMPVRLLSEITFWKGLKEGDKAASPAAQNPPAQNAI